MSKLDVNQTTAFECEACGHEWSGPPRLPTTAYHQWESCPNCGADDGENCWDCGETSEDQDMDMCTACRHTICMDCQRPHHGGRERDHGVCGKTKREL
jgi:hypothetical protein